MVASAERLALYTVREAELFSAKRILSTVDLQMARGDHLKQVCQSVPADSNAIIPDAHRYIGLSMIVIKTRFSTVIASDTK